MKKGILLSSALLLITLTGLNAAAQNGETKPLHSFLSSKGYRLYKIGANLPPGLSDGPWKDEGIVAHVMPNQVSGTKPVFQLVTTQPWVAFAYTSDPAEANKWKGGPGFFQWMNQGPTFYVAAVQLPGTVPLHRLYAPLRQTNPGQTFTGPVQGTGAHFYTTKNSEKTHATNNGWVYEGIVGYVWKEPFPPAAPDLIIEKSTADDSSVRVVVANKGKMNTGGQPVNVALFIYDRSGKQILVTAKNTGGLSAGQSSEVIIPAGNVGLRNRRYKLTVDSNYTISESNENNNETAMLDGPKGLKITPLPPGHVYPPSISLIGIQPAQGGRTTYRLAVTNWQQFKPDSFQSMENVLPPNPCGGTDTHARLIARILVKKKGVPMDVPAGCKPLNSPQDLQTLDFSIPAKLDDNDRVLVSVVDRGTDVKYDSTPYSIGWFGLGKVLKTVGCEYFLGRAGHYLCSTDQGMAACENLQTKGKPIQCTRAGKPAK